MPRLPILRSLFPAAEGRTRRPQPFSPTTLDNAPAGRR